MIKSLYLCKTCNHEKEYYDMRRHSKSKCNDCFNKLRRERRKEGRYTLTENYYSDISNFGMSREIIFRRDSYACTKCKSTDNLIFHHKDGSGYVPGKNKRKDTNNNIDNLQTLCRKCHNELHLSTEARRVRREKLQSIVA